MTTLKGRLLVANPAMPDPNFHRTVVLLLAHQDDGALGVVLNRPSELDVDSPLPRWERLVADPPVVFVGGPVAPGAAICLARVPDPPPEVPDAAAHHPSGMDREGLGGWVPLVGELGTLDLERDPDDLVIRVDAIRVFAGYAGWGPGQLEGEIDAGAWFVVVAESGDALSGDPDQLWKRVLRRQGGRLALVAAYPNEPSLN
ncbi:MAG: putative transcriptional regulator [Acidimicrobiaceae bacterium]|nr:putative transcriptional regulator [Acidimicrobiaceae bacterium]MDQ1365033.1 putative transcriptional regulator [Acidimicrobiaceae bacterium]MDQ1398766.1 putative transcriptional regulator [Acidimicrobiaceae bacterium]MDQ1412478.1 putative transcriptional regulator [Acidimicrobiaceae bacterium]MDQ1441220.1 putative transcriptional regulator [Acidimicrobiaceae bacterium]